MESVYKYLKITLGVLCLLRGLSAGAYDFMVDGIAYNINEDGNSVTVTYENPSWPRYTNLSGDLIINSSVSYNGKTYAVTNIGDNAFSVCNGLTDVSIPYTVTIIGESAFDSCTNLATITIGDNVSTIRNFAFRGCKSLTNTTIPNSVSTIGNYAYSGCKELAYVLIPKNMTTIGEGAFAHCSNLLSIIVDSENQYYDSRENCNAIIETSSNTLIAGCQNSIIPNSVTSISHAFYGCTDLTSVIIPESVTTIGDYAFCGCDNLTSLVIPDNVSTIGNSAFSGCSGLTYINIPDNVSTIGNRAFSGCAELTHIDIPNNVSTIEDYVFSGCSSLTDIDIPDCVTSIGESAFENCTNMTTITIGNNVSSIGGSAFWGCTSLTNAIIGNNVTVIGQMAFRWCSNLTYVNLGNHLTDIEYGAFWSCTNLTQLNIPKSVIKIGADAFWNCSGLESIRVEEGNQKFDSRDDCNAIINTASNKLLVGCKNTIIPNSIESIDNYAFGGCIGLINIDIPNSVKTIGKSAFYYCTNLTRVSLGNGVNSIGDYSFYYCNNLLEVHSKIENPFILPSNVFNNVTLSNGTLYVPEGTQDAYQALAIWNRFGRIIEVDENGNYIIKVDSLYISPNELTLQKGEQAQLSYQIVPQNAYNQNVTWSSSNNDVAQVDSNGIVSALENGTTRIICTTTDGTNISANCIVSVNTFSTSLSLNKETVSIYVGGEETLVATILPSDVTNNRLIWTSNNNNVASVDQNGKVTAKSIGTATITATTTDGTNISASCEVTVTGITSLQLNESNTSIYVGGMATLVATVLPSDVIIKTLEWNTSNTNVTIINQMGMVWAIAPGSAIITATTTDGTNISDSCLVNVTGITSVQLNKDSTSIYVGGEESLVATISPSDVIISTLDWASSNSNVATVDQTGKINAKAPGTAIITATATDGSNVSANCVVNVTGITSLQLNKSNTSIYVGGEESLVATISPSDVINNTLDWTSSDSYVATVDQNGKVTAKAIGTATITATTTDGTNISASCHVDVMGITHLSLNKDEFMIFKGDSETLTATIEPSDVIINMLIWQSSNSSIVAVDDNGNITAKSVGSAVITVSTTDGSDLHASCEVTVLPQYALQLDKSLFHTRGAQPEVVELAIGMTNQEEISGLQFDLYLPDGVTMGYLNGLPDVWLDEIRKGRNHSVDVTPTAYGYRVLVSSPTNRVFNGHYGDVLHMNVVLSQYHPIGNYIIKLSNIILAEPDETQHNASYVTTGVQFSYLLGDADSDVSVDVADYTITALHILSRNPEHFYSDAADVNDDNNINVTDLIGITNIGLGIRPQELHHIRSHVVSQPLQSTNKDFSFSAHVLNHGQLELSLSNNYAIAGLQCDLDLPPSVHISSMELLGRAAKHQLSTSILPNGKVRLLVSSFSNFEIPSGEDAILRITLDGTTNGIARLTDILCVERDMTSYALDEVLLYLEATGVNSLDHYEQIRIYVEDGQIVIESPHKGTAQLVQVNGIATPLRVHQGRNLYPISSGFYMVHFKGQTAKIKK